MSCSINTLLRGTALALLLVAGHAEARDIDAPGSPPPAPEAPVEAEPPAPPLPPPALPTPLGVPQGDTATPVGDWRLESFRLPGREDSICVVTREYPSGERLGFIVGELGRGLIYGRPNLQVREGTTMDFGFSVDQRPPLGLEGQAYDPNSIMSAPVPSPQGEKLLAIFAKGAQAYIGSNDLNLRSSALDLTGAAKAIEALDRCVAEKNIQVVTVDIPPAAPEPSAGAPVTGSTFDDGHGTGAPPPPPLAPAAPAETSPAQEAIRDAISAEAKKRKAGVGYALALPKDVTGDGMEDIVLIFTLLEGETRQGYATVLKTVGPNQFQTLNTIELGGVPTDDPAIFTDWGMVVALRGETPDKPVEVDVLITPDELILKK